MERQCPHCIEAPLRPVMVEGAGVEIDHCTRCEGLWLDRGELENLLGDTAASLSLPADAHRTRRCCPDCRKTMYTFYYPRTFVEIDMCVQCSGVWLDSNEFQEIDVVLHHLASNPEEEPEPDVAQTSVPEGLLRFIDNTISAYKFWH